MNELLHSESAIRNEATELLETLLLPLLENYGEVEVGGSYVYKLMYQRDIDIILVSSEVSKDSYADLCREMVALSCVSKFRTADRVNYPHQPGSGRPTGYWLSPTIQFKNNEWELDIWLQTPNQVDGNNARFKSALEELSTEQKVQVLQLKKELKEAGRYGVANDFQSVDVYNEVLKNQSNDDLRKHFKLN